MMKKKIIKKHTHDALHKSHETIDSIETVPEVIEGALKLGESLSHPSPVLEVIGHIFPPLRLVFESLAMILDIANVGLLQKGRVPSRFLRIGLSVAIIGLAIAAFVVPAVAGILFVTMAGIALGKQAIRLVDSIYDLYQQSQQIKLLQAEQTRLEKLMEQELKTDPDNFLRAIEQTRIHHGKIPHELCESLYRMVYRNPQDPLFKEIKQKLDLDDPFILEIKDYTPKLNYQEMLERYVQQQHTLEEKEKHFKEHKSKTIQAAIQLGLAVVGLVGVVLLITPLAPVGLGLLAATVVGGIAATVGFKIYENNQKKHHQLLAQKDKVEMIAEKVAHQDTSSKMMHELHEHRHPEKIEKVEKVEKIKAEKIPPTLVEKPELRPQNQTQIILDSDEEETEGGGEHPHR